MSITLDGTNGITTPDVTSSGALNVNASAPDNSLVVDSSGNLLVGTTSTVAEVTSSDTSSGFTFKGMSAGNSLGGVGSTSRNDYALQLNRQGNTDGGIVAFRRNGTQAGSISVTTTATAYNISSDYRLKEDWQPMTGASERVKALKPVNFAWKVNGSRVDGFLAHEAQAVVPEAVTGEKDAVDAEGKPVYQGIDQSKLVPLLTAALQEALAKIDEQQQAIAGLTARVEALEANNV